MAERVQAYSAPLISAVIALIVSLYTVKKVIFITQKRKLYDIPDNIRKIHGEQIPSLGGIGIFTGFMATVPVLTEGMFHEVQMVIVSSVILFFTGIYDDIMNMRPSKKLAAQLLASFITIYFSDLRLATFSGINIPYYIDIPVTTIACTFFINVFNFIDGIDGLAGMLAIFYSTLLAFLFFTDGASGLACMAFSLAGATLGLLYYNYPPAKIYMGDTGSMLLGFILFVLAMHFATTGSGTILMAYRPWLIVALFSLPVFDAIRVFILRAMQGISPLKADRRHLHHYLLDSGLSHASTAISLTAVNMVTVALAFLCIKIGHPALSAAVVLVLPASTAYWASSRLNKKA